MTTKSENVPVKHGNGGQAFHPLLSLREDIDRMFDQFVSGWPGRSAWEGFAPLASWAGSRCRPTPMRKKSTPAIGRAC